MADLVFELPVYVENVDQENYNVELNQTLREMLSSTGWFMPTLTTAQVTELLAMDVPPQVGTFWFNGDNLINAPQVVVWVDPTDHTMGVQVKTFTIV